ncbi:MAG: GNAT family N-acetyltransferase [Cyclobacteriaceae bacterium]|nr:GNAT family N-acetyltransferase [Cyclobacteriaceae bacterium HetDA_MAG_MS6]
MLTFRVCRIDDLEKLQEIIEQTFMDAFAHQNQPQYIQAYASEFLTIGHVRKELLNPESTFYFATLKTEIIGYFKLNLGQAQMDLQEEGGVELQRIYVINNHQGLGLGEQMLKQAINIAKQSGLPFLWLGVWEKNLRAVTFYERHGFEKFGKHSFMMGEEEQWDYLMKRRLD